MSSNRTTYSDAFLKRVRSFAVTVAEGNMQREVCTLSRCRLTGLQTSKWRSVNINRQEERRSKKRKLAEVYCDENSIFYQKYNIE
ncbi:unnamed protein product [Schistosoma rodhaini]|nr:unnamed protein product [Schistosoma rodhaini]